MSDKRIFRGERQARLGRGDLFSPRPGCDPVLLRPPTPADPRLGAVVGIIHHLILTRRVSEEEHATCPRLRVGLGYRFPALFLPFFAAPAGNRSASRAYLTPGICPLKH